MTILKDLEKYEPSSLHHEVPVVWDTASGWLVYSGGKAYIDFTSGIFVANIGHSRVKVVKAIRQQIAKNLLHSYVFPNEPRSKLVKKLAGLSGMDKVFLCSTGSEAVEAAIRCMKEKKDGLIWGIKEANHGRTWGATHIIEKFMDYSFYPSSRITLPISGIIFETYLGYNAQFHPVDWVQTWCEWAKKNNIPVCFDEVQAGFGRTGKMFGFEHYGVKPDLIVVGKALSGSLPISAVMGGADLLDAPDDLSSTHTGNPVCCAAALANLEVLESEHLVERSAMLGEKLASWLPEMFPQYTIRGKGMVWAIDLQDIELANTVVDISAEKGLLMVKTHRGTLKIGAPLIIPEDVLYKGLEIIQDSLWDTLQSKSRGV